MVKLKRRRDQVILVKRIPQGRTGGQKRRNRKVLDRQGILVVTQAVEQRLPQVRVRIIS